MSCTGNDEQAMSDLIDAGLEKAKLEKAKLEEAKLEKAKLEKAKLEKVELSHLNKLGNDVLNACEILLKSYTEKKSLCYCPLCIVLGNICTNGCPHFIIANRHCTIYEKKFKEHVTILRNTLHPEFTEMRIIELTNWIGIIKDIDKCPLIYKV